MIPDRLKVKIYWTFIQPVLVGGAETWALNIKEHVLVRTEMRMIRWAMKVSLKEHTTNQVRQLTGVGCANKREIERYPTSLVWPRPEERKRPQSEESWRLASHWEEKKRKPKKDMEGQCKERHGIEEAAGGRCERQNKWRRLVHVRPTPWWNMAIEEDVLQNCQCLFVSYTRFGIENLILCHTELLWALSTR